MTAITLPLRFQVGARTLATIPRRLVRVGLSLDDVLSGQPPSLPPLPADAHGYLVTSLPESLLRADDVLTTTVRQHYSRYHADLTIGFDAWFATLSANTRSGLKRKAKRLAQASGGALDIRRYRTPDELSAFHPLARIVSATTYQERLLDAGLPADPAGLKTLATADRVRAWLMFVDDKPLAYLCGTAEGSALRYDHVGHDPAIGDLSPGAVLQLEAMRDLFAERRFARFDFTEGEGQHKRQFATAGTPCVDLLLLRRTVSNQATVAALAGFDRAIALAKRAAVHPALHRIARRVRRAA